MSAGDMRDARQQEESHAGLYQEKFSRYWHHYAAMQTWMAAYVQAHRARCSWYPTPGYQPAPYSLVRPPAHWSPNAPSGPAHCASSAPGYRDEAPQSDRDCSSDDVSESESMDIEMSQEMLDFFRASQRFREERDRAKAEAAKSAKKRQGDPMKAEDRQDCRAPVERPDEGRRRGMKALYGEHSVRIHSMETAMQMQFDRNCDRFQPSYWPIVALKL